MTINKLWPLKLNDGEYVILIRIYSLFLLNNENNFFAQSYDFKLIYLIVVMLTKERHGKQKKVDRKTYISK